MDLVIATLNEGKFREFVQLLNLPSLQLRSLDQFPGLPPALEQGATFAENARIKARHYHRLLSAAVLADDSGLEVDLLSGEPGIYSARYSGCDASDRENVGKLLRELRHHLGPEDGNQSLPVAAEDRSYCLLSPARFICALSLFDSGSEQFFTQGKVEGFISSEPRGHNGFGYDPVFFVWQEGKTMAELAPSIKNRISHRSQAAQNLRSFLQDRRQPDS
jgi:XTP/dITP diphosphohydrolase